MDTGDALKPALWVSVILALWMARCLRTIFYPGEINVGRIVSGLLAGIIFVDWIAVAPQCPRWLGAVFLVLFWRNPFVATIRSRNLNLSPL